MTQGVPGHNLAHPADLAALADPVGVVNPAARLIEFFEHLTPASVERLGEFYTPNAWFKDPFNEVRGVAGIQHVFNHMFVALDQPRFVVTDCLYQAGQAGQGGQCFLTWNFEFHLKRFDRAALQTIRGGSHLRFTADGLIDFHRDYWDAAEELYEKLPVLGGLMRWLKKRANSS